MRSPFFDFAQKKRGQTQCRKIIRNIKGQTAYPEVDMVGHQHIGMQLYRVLLTGLTKVTKVELVIVFSEETTQQFTGAE
jgi:hypothetical protein